jgi:hypothetical protein
MNQMMNLKLKLNNMRLRRFNESLDEDIKIIEDILIYLKDDFTDIKIEVNKKKIDNIVDIITLSIDATNILDDVKDGMERFKKVNTYQTNLIECLDRISEALNSKVVIYMDDITFTIGQKFDNNHLFSRDKWINNISVSFPQKFLIKNK